ncbi:MAG: YfiR family protein [Bacteroidales bacterium]|jgi:hypothetical protein|nr:YfiR family protein [Bacteroidales bacterium]
MRRFFFTLFSIIFLTNVSYGQTGVSRAQANRIYNFTKFFDWPQTQKSGDFIIGVFGSKELFKELEKITKDKKNVTQNIVVKFFNSYNNIDKCHVIFVTSLKSQYIGTVYKQTGVHCLIISNDTKAIEKGATIQFFIQDQKLKYDFSQENALNHGLKFHSKVSEMATKK